MHTTWIISAPVVVSNTVVNPGAVVIKVVHTLVTLPAVLSPYGTDGLAGMAHVVHWIVEVVILTPAGRVTNLTPQQKCTFTHYTLTH